MAPRKAASMIHASRYKMADGMRAFPPQVGPGYGAFWLRDYAYQLEGCADVFSDKELNDSCRVFVNALRRDGAGVDCVKFSGQPIYMPGYGPMGAESRGRRLAVHRRRGLVHLAEDARTAACSRKSSTNW